MPSTYPGAVDVYDVPSAPTTTPLGSAGDADPARNAWELLRDLGAGVTAVQTELDTYKDATDGAVAALETGQAERPLAGEASQYGARLDAGCANHHDRRAPASTLAGAALATGICDFTYFRWPWEFTAARMRMISAGTAAGATPTLCRFGLYTVDGDGDLDLIAAIANDTALFAATNTAYVRDLTATHQGVPGNWYATGVLVVSGATMPSLVGANAVAATNLVLGSAPRLNGRIAGQADLPAHVDAANVVAAATQHYAELLEAA